jgi:hypothetical protein
MDKPRKKIRIVGERRPELDLTRFADALITFALHRLKAGIAADEELSGPDAEAQQEAS